MKLRNVGRKFGVCEHAASTTFDPKYQGRATLFLLSVLIRIISLIIVQWKNFRSKLKSPLERKIMDPTIASMVK